MIYTDEFFDSSIDRRGSRSSKWDGCNAKFGVPENAELLPMWIADMDFRSPEEVAEAITRRAEAGIYGYTIRPDSFYECITNWVMRRYGWEAEKEQIVFTPGVVPGLHIAVQSLTEPGDGIIVQTPVYYPFMEAGQNTGRKVEINRLTEDEDGWHMDFEDLEMKASQPQNKLMILCNPHNPVGRAWSAEELSRVAEICLKNGVFLVSDEIHADIIMNGAKHTAVCSLSEKYRDCTLTCYAPSKTFNLAGLQTSYFIIPNGSIREKFLAGLSANRVFNINCFGGVALEAAYTHCEGYVKALCSYVDANMDFMKKYIDERLPELSMRKPEATYMAWVDFRRTGMKTEEIEDFIIHQAHIAPDMGSWFGPGGAGFLRFNLACPRRTVARALTQLEKALHFKH